MLTDVGMQSKICLTGTLSVKTQLKWEAMNVLTCLVQLVKAKGDAHHDDGESSIVSPSVACWTWTRGGRFI